jgi:myo-inositol 2-dehydrogenase / D-chiro-inositol 1-dehydrogenase
MTHPAKNVNRRSFLKNSLTISGGMFLLPGLISECRSAEVTGVSPNRKIQIAQIGCGRMGHADLTNVLTEPLGRVVAVCDLDSVRLAKGKELAENYYLQSGETKVQVKSYHDYHDLLSSREIDAVVITVPDHSHALVAVEAALAGKHIYVQKPVTYSIAEAIGLRTAVEAKKTILQTGSQQRSEHPWGSFRAASEAVRNGRIGQVKTIKIGIGLDKPSGIAPHAMPIPKNLNFERWLGPAPEQAYMEGRVHPQNTVLGRPGWMTTEDFGLGMITNWGAHHVDIAQWALGQELGGPLTVDGHAEFMHNDMWTVHTTYHIEMEYPNAVRVILDNNFENGILFEGDEGTVFCTRSEERPAQIDPNTAAGREAMKPLRASDLKILSPLGSDAKRWMPSKSHYGNWLESIVAKREPIAPIQQSARSLETCAAAWISMKLGRKLNWNSKTEMFENDPAANALRQRKARKPEYDFAVALKKAGLA